LEIASKSAGKSIPLIGVMICDAGGEISADKTATAHSHFSNVARAYQMRAVADGKEENLGDEDEAREDSFGRIKMEKGSLANPARKWQHAELRCRSRTPASGDGTSLQ
jgi:hypothetical protein